MAWYGGVGAPPSFLDRFGQGAREGIRNLIRLLFGGRGGGPQVANWIFYLIGAVALAAVAIVVFRFTRGRFHEDAIASQATGPRAPADYFAEADRLAAEGDRVGAIRALCAGVAATLAGGHTWGGGPLTGREVFPRAPGPTRLNPP